MGFLSKLNPAKLIEKAGLPNPGEDYIKGPERAAQISADATLQAAREAEALNRERYAESLERLSPYMESELQARNQLAIEMGLTPGEASTAYMNAPGYQMAIDEGTRAVNQGAANTGALYSGARGAALRDVGQGVQQSFYSNYMNLLSNMAQPQVTQNISSLGMGQAATIGGQNIGASQAAGNYMQTGAAATQQATGDALGSIIGLFL